MDATRSRGPWWTHVESGTIAARNPTRRYRRVVQLAMWHHRSRERHAGGGRLELAARPVTLSRSRR
ncbi:hypothetical protein BKA56DRAFT_583359 [Ilyonectria sp. MPI-CAGE-AT-0026]|nr:hypothetical protein BKA56DRAFT_583359 [Ilyonectria sp. MPI-CAGE-AT-0026]